MANIGVRRNAFFGAEQETPRPVSPPTVPKSPFPQMPTQQETTANSWFSGEQNVGGSSAAINFPTLGNPAADIVLGYGMERLYDSGQQFVSTGLGSYFSFVNGLRPYFNVDNSYVLNKLRVLLFPLKHHWEKKSNPMFSSEPPLSFQPPMQGMPSVMMTMENPSVAVGNTGQQRDLNDPDLYIPTMAFVTYVLLVGFLLGTDNSFTPEVLATIATKALLLTLVEIGAIKAVFYALRAPTSLSFLDVSSYCGYKFVGVVLSIIAAVFFGSYAYFTVAFITSFFMLIFMKNTLRRAGLHTLDASNRISMDNDANKRNYFTLIVALLQVPLSFLLSYPYAKQLILWSALSAASAGTVPIATVSSNTAETLVANNMG